ncbi:hypothetical protein COO60DRAFT_1463689 [Scenedesmus sp. NREL 46B-D3]|nr:hypothetical protein COO60DRAFT_1463689 [Scenedesmus sp. NREL 46B-D3]
MIKSSCLSNKTLTFVGDSLSRYQYLNLAYFLSHGRYMQRYGNDDGNRSLAQEGMWGNYSIFYTEGSKALQYHSPAVNASEVCDCRRLGLDATTREDRTLTVSALIPAAPRQPVNKTADAAAFKVGYRQAFGMKTNVLSETLDAIQRATQGTSSFDHIILVNIGHWFHKGMTSPSNSYHAVAAAYEPLFVKAAAKAAAGRGKAQIIWKSTTAISVPRALKEMLAVQDWHHLLTSMARHYKWSVMDAFDVTSSLAQTGVDGFWDRLHFHAFVYDQLNDVLLNGLC